MRKTKRLISLFVIASILVISSIISVSAVSIEYKGFSVDIDSSSSTAKIVEYYGTDSDISIPSSVYGYTVTSIDQYAFYQNETIETVVFPNTVTSIGFMAFAECPNLKSVINSNSLTSMGISAFYKCTSLEEVYINSALNRVPDSAFSSCSSLKKVRLNYGVKTIGFSAFAGCTSLTTMPECPGVNTIEDYAFYNCGFKKITLENTISSIGDSSFASCSNLEEVSVNNSEIKIGNNAFTDSADNLILKSSFGSTTEKYCEDNNITFKGNVLYGDVNNDEIVNIKDVTYLQKYLVGMDGFDIEENTRTFYASDVDGDEQIDIGDALNIFRFVNHEISIFPVEE